MRKKNDHQMANDERYTLKYELKLVDFKRHLTLAEERFVLMVRFGGALASEETQNLEFIPFKDLGSTKTFTLDHVYKSKSMYPYNIMTCIVTLKREVSSGVNVRTVFASGSRKIDNAHSTNHGKFARVDFEKLYSESMNNEANYNQSVSVQYIPTVDVRFDIKVSEMRNVSCPCRYMRPRSSLVEILEGENKISRKEINKGYDERIVQTNIGSANYLDDGVCVPDNISLSGQLYPAFTACCRQTGFSKSAIADLCIYIVNNFSECLKRRCAAISPDEFFKFFEDLRRAPDSFKISSVKQMEILEAGFEMLKKSTDDPYAYDKGYVTNKGFIDYEDNVSIVYSDGNDCEDGTSYGYFWKKLLCNTNWSSIISFAEGLSRKQCETLRRLEKSFFAFLRNFVAGFAILYCKNGKSLSRYIGNEGTVHVALALFPRSVLQSRAPNLFLHRMCVIIEMTRKKYSLLYNENIARENVINHYIQRHRSTTMFLSRNALARTEYARPFSARESWYKLLSEFWSNDMIPQTPNVSYVFDSTHNSQPTCSYIFSKKNSRKQKSWGIRLSEVVEKINNRTSLFTKSGGTWTFEKRFEKTARQSSTIALKIFATEGAYEILPRKSAIQTFKRNANAIPLPKYNKILDANDSRVIRISMYSEQFDDIKGLDDARAFEFLKQWTKNYEILKISASSPSVSRMHSKIDVYIK